MIEGGEILRAVMTSGTKVRKQKYYTQAIEVLGVVPVGGKVSAQLQFEKNANFMMTGIVVTEMMRSFASAVKGQVPAVAKIELTFPMNSKRMQLDLQMAASVYSDRVNNMSDFEEYVMFESNETVTITITKITAQFDAIFYVTMCGIEFRN